MAKTTLDVDEVKLDAAKHILGTRTLRDTVDRALDAVLALAARRRTVNRLRRMAGLELDNPEVMDAAWH